AACRIALDDVELAAARVALLAIGKLSRQRKAVERAFAAREVAGFAGGHARARRIEGLADDLARVGRMFFEIGSEAVVDERFDEAFDLAVAELGLGLAFELRLRDLDRKHGRTAFAAILALDGFVAFLDKVIGGAVVVDRARQGRAD